MTDRTEGPPRDADSKSTRYTSGPTDGASRPSQGQGALFSHSGATAAADLGIARVRRRAERTMWLQAAVEWIAITARRQDELTTDDVLKVWQKADDAVPGMHIPPACPEPRAWGSAMRIARRRGICAPTPSYRSAGHVRSHGRPKRVWRSLVRGDR